MYQRDQSAISAFAQSSPEALFETVTFVLLTIQQSIFDMPTQCTDVRLNGGDSHFLWGFKNNAYEWHKSHRQDVYQSLMDTYHGYADPLICESELLLSFAALPGLGLVKGGFANQLIFGMSGCIDSHNQAIFEVSPNQFKASRFKSAKPKTRSRLVSEYQHLCWDVGGSEYLWDNWCGYVADKNNTTADAVSKLHVSAIME